MIQTRSGVVGTCEEEGLGLQDLCNFYYSFNPSLLNESFSSQLVLSAGEIGTSLRAGQLAFAIGHIKRNNPSAKLSGRWVIQTLHSSLSETSSLCSIQSHLPLIDESLRGHADNEDLAVLHLNTCFDVSFHPLLETSSSLKSYNLECLAKLIQFVLLDATQLFRAEEVFAPFLPKDGGGYLNKQCSLICSLAEKIKDVKSKIYRHQLTHELLHLLDLENKLAVLKDSPLSESREERIRILEEKHRKAEKSLRPYSAELIRDLNQYQADILEQLRKMTGQIADVIDMIEKYEESHVFVSIQAALLFRVLHAILTSQLSLNGERELSKSGQLECLLLLYRLLDINLVMVSKDGLNGSGSLAAMGDALSQLERELFLQSSPQTVDMNPDNQKKVLAMAHQKMFALIFNLDHNRRCFFAMAASGDETTVKWNRGFSSMQPLLETNEREVLLKKIKASGDDESQDILKNSFYYLENVTTELLGPQSEKALNSTGVRRFKFPKVLSGDPRSVDHVETFNRCAPFLSVGEETIRLFTFHKNESGDHYTMTDLAASIFQVYHNLKTI